MKKILLVSILISSIYGKESWIQEKERQEKYKQENEEYYKKIDKSNEEYYKKIEQQKKEREIERYNQKTEQERIEKLNNLKANENEELSTPFLFDGKVVSLHRGSKDYLSIKNNDSYFNLILKEGEASTYSYHIQNKSKVSGGCYNLNSNGYYNCWFTFQY